MRSCNPDLYCRVRRFYKPEEEHLDGGGWEGGIQVLGGCGLATIQGLSRRDILADAAMRRMQREKNEGS